MLRARRQRPSLCWILLFFLAAGCSQARIIPGGTRSIPGAPPGEPVLIPPASEWLMPGEELEYQICWWGVSVGTAILDVVPAGDGKRVYLMFKARSNPYLEVFYPVRAELTSLFDPEARSPRRFQAIVRRRWRRHDSVITFDPEKKTAFHQLPKGRSATVPIGPVTQDGISLIYYARSLDMRVGQTIPLQISADGKNWDLSGRIVRTSAVKLKGLGTWPAMEGTVELAYPVPFFQGARASIWFGADGRKVPLFAKIRSRIGPVTVALLRRSFRKGGPPADPFHLDKF